MEPQEGQNPGQLLKASILKYGNPANQNQNKYIRTCYYGDFNRTVSRPVKNTKGYLKNTKRMSEWWKTLITQVGNFAITAYPFRAYYLTQI